MTVLLTVFSSFLAIGHLGYYWVTDRLWRGLRKMEKEKKGDVLALKAKVTVLVAMRNEQDVVRQCVDSLLAQNYPRELSQYIFINDRSTDKTPEILRQYEKDNPQCVQVLDVAEGESSLSPKKYALIKGIAGAKGDWILSTDADCRFGPNWIHALLSEAEPGVDMILGLTSYYKMAGVSPLFLGMQSLEFFSYSFVSASLVANGFPVHANANNLAYRRDIFRSVQKFRKDDRIVNGDDVFLLQKIYSFNPKGIRFARHPDSFVETRPSLTWRQTWEQRKRWASGCGFYDQNPRMFLTAIYSYYLLIFICLVFGIFSSTFFFVGLVSWVFKSGFDYRVTRLATDRFGKRELLKWFLPTAILHIPLIVLAVLFGNFGSFQWKGQKVRKKLTSLN